MHAANVAMGLGLVWVAMTVACGGSSGSAATSPEPSPIARIHKAKCGSCHTRVEPGERTRAQLESAFPRHQKRVHLTDAQWGEMLDYLAAREDAGAPPSP